ncbi:MAG TPA: hypothetical protein PLB38_03975 [bacterium]|nr:hypothetical protein [bacterium]
MVNAKTKIPRDLQDSLSEEMDKDMELLSTVEEELEKVDSNQYDPQRLALIKYSLESIKTNVEKILRLMDDKYEVKSDDFITAGMVADSNIESALDTQRSVELHDPAMINGQRVVEGVFDGNTMIGSDGKQYTVPANYASKSKLVEGDILKLTITNAGSFIFKQIAPIERRRLIGSIEYDEMKHQYYASLNGKKWRLLTASVTYFKGEPGDEVVFIIPKNTASRWAAVENIIKDHDLAGDSDDAQTGRPVDSPNPFSNNEIDFLGTGEL